MATHRTTTTTSSGNAINPDVFKWLLIIGVVFVVWILLTRKTAVGSSSGGGGGLVGGGGSGSYPFQQQPQQGGGGGIGASIPGAGGSPASASNLSSFLGGWLSSVLNTGWANAATLQIDNGYEPGGALDNLSIPYEPTALFDVNQLATDIPGYGDTSGLGTIDTNITDGSIPYDTSGDGSSIGLIDTNITDGSIGGYDPSTDFTSFNDNNFNYGGAAEYNDGLNQGFA